VLQPARDGQHPWCGVGTSPRRGSEDGERRGERDAEGQGNGERYCGEELQTARR
jgi:hypothetical protein